jgi:hypothetical protein
MKVRQLLDYLKDAELLTPDAEVVYIVDGMPIQLDDIVYEIKHGVELMVLT